MSIRTDYETRLTRTSDINEIMPILHDYASTCDVVVEFGVRTGNSTAALLAGLEESEGFLYSYDIKPPQCDFEKDRWEFTQADTAAMEEIPECDLLFIDTLHTADQVTAELKHHKQVRRLIAFHDTMLFGDKGEGRQGGYGISHAIYTFLAEQEGVWKVKEHFPHNNGLLVLERVA